MVDYFDMIVQGGPLVWSLLVIVLLAFLAIAANFIRKRKSSSDSPIVMKKKPKPDAQLEEKKVLALADYRARHGDKAASVIEELMNQEGMKVQAEVNPIRLDEGPFKCIAFLTGGIMKWTTITEPVGELYQADTACPVSGGVYIVKQMPNGEVIDYDPREVAIVTEETPEIAWFATHWNIVKRVFALPQVWWKSTSTWFAVGMMVIVFIVALVVAGG